MPSITMSAVSKLFSPKIGSAYSDEADSHSDLMAILIPGGWR